VPVRAEVAQADALSAHAGASDVFTGLAAAPAPVTTHVVHGEPSAAAAPRDRLDRDLGWTAVVPAWGERVIIRARQRDPCLPR
jgi:metallo-beta-lactamase family protein